MAPRVNGIDPREIWFDGVPIFTLLLAAWATAMLLSRSRDSMLIGAKARWVRNILLIVAIANSAILLGCLL